MSFIILAMTVAIMTVVLIIYAMSRYQDQIIDKILVPVFFNLNKFIEKVIKKCIG